jgi:alkaline phosphatase D
VRRRRFLALASTSVIAACPERRVTVPPAPRAPAFTHGVASGDPLADRVVLWTRVDTESPVEVTWTIASDEALAQVVARGTVTTSGERDHTVKVDATGLQPGQTYHYGFAIGDVRSPTGRTRTLPAAQVERVQLAYTSCSNYPYGYFTVYGAIAARDDLDAVLHLGDYLYEYGDETYGEGTALGRVPDPIGECRTLDDYRRRHATYRRDADLQEAHRRHPFIVVWDDHEIANDTWTGGAENHQPEDGDWAQRRTAAVRAWREWMPVRDHGGDPREIHRSFRFGDLLDLFMLDTRVIGRDRQLEPSDVAAIGDARRTLLGAAQEQWLLDGLARSQGDAIAWRVLGQQVMMAQLRGPDGVIRNPDMWDGYPSARERILDAVAKLGIGDLLVLTGDIHSSWANEVRRDPFASPPSPALAIELVSPAVSSPPPRLANSIEELQAGHPHIRWVDVQHRGYVTLALSKQDARATWHLLEAVDRPGLPVRAAKSFAIPRGKPELVEV